VFCAAEMEPPLLTPERVKNVNFRVRRPLLFPTLGVAGGRDAGSRNLIDCTGRLNRSTHQMEISSNRVFIN